MRILGLQHARIEHPAYFKKMLDEDGHSYIGIELDEGEQIPELNNFDGLWVLGGPMDVWDEDKYPWLIDEKKFIYDSVVKKGIPYLGLCLGHQLLAEALGGEVKKSDLPEVGVMDVNLTVEGSSGVFFDGLPETFKCLQWHGAEVSRLPEGGNNLAFSENCQNQAMKWGTRAYSVQFHLEAEHDTIKTWSGIPEYAEALKDAKGSKGINILKSECDNEMKKFNEYAERVYINWMQTSAST